MLKLQYDNQDDIEEKYRDLYTESGGKWNLTGITGLKTQADIDRVQTSLTTERNAHKATKDRLRAVTFGGKSVIEMNDDELKDTVEKLDKYDELEAAAGKMDDEKLNKIVEGRLRSKLAPVERERDQLKTQLADAAGKITEFETERTRRKIHDSVHELKGKLKFRDEAAEDILWAAERVLQIDDAGNVVTKDGVGVTPGVSAEVWLTEIQPKKPHWWSTSRGGGAGGNNGGGFARNPWLKEHWNMTEQGRIVTENPQKAEQMAKAAGVEIGATRAKAA